MIYNGSISILIGIALIIISIIYPFVSLLIITLKNSKCTLRVTATVIEIDKRVIRHTLLGKLSQTIIYTPIFEYMVNGYSYKIKGKNEYEDVIKIGDTKDFFCDASKPYIVINKFNNIYPMLIIFIILILLGLSFILYGIIKNLI